MFVQSSVLIILLLIIDFMLRKKVRAVFRYCVWMLVFIKLILPPTISLPTGIGYWCGDSLSTEHIISKPIADNTSTAESTMSDMSEEFANSSEPSEARSSQVPSESAAAITPVMSENRAKITEPIRDPPSQSPPAPATLIESIMTTLSVISWQSIVFLIWFVGVLVFSMLLIQRMLSVLGLIAQSEPAKGRLLEALNQCRRQVGIGRNVELKLSNHVQSPAVCGFFKPIILMPTALLEKLSDDKLRAVLIHELVHIERGDLWINFAQTFLQIIYFYNPFVWLANAVVRRIREQAVDEAVLVAMGAEAKSYSNTLIDIAEMAFFKASFGLRLIGVAESKKALHRRIRHMLSRPIPKSARVGVFRIAIIIVIAAVLLPMARAEKPAESDKPVQDIALTEPGTVDPFVLRIRAFIDGSDYIKIRGTSLWYEHQKWDLPGKWWNRLANIKHDEPTYINGKAWKPEWEGRVSKPYIMKQATLPKEVNDRINLTKIFGRGSVSIAETPKPQNDYTLSVLLDDNLYNKAQWYEVVIQTGRRETPEKKQAKTESKQSVDAASHPEGTGNLLVRVTGKGIKAHWGVQAYPAGEKLGVEDRIDSSGFELDQYVFRGLKEGDYVVMAPIPFGIAGVNGKATVQLNGWTRATVEPGKDIRAEIDFKENAGIRGVFQCLNKNLSWRIILLDGADKSCGSSSSEITQARALGWKLERSGFYEINYLSPGAYTIIGRICKKGENWIPVKEKKKTFTISEGEVAVVDFNFPSEPGDVGISTSSSTGSLPQIPAANDLPGTLIFRGQYKHLNRGNDYGQPSVLWLKQTHDKGITAVAHMPLRGTTIIASGDKENRLTHYKEEQSASGNRPGYLMDLELLDNKVLLTLRGVRQDIDGEEWKVPEGALFNPNSRPDSYCTANILLRGFNLAKGQSKEFHVYDWNNTGKAFADYTIRVEYAGTESVDVPAGRFETSHFVLTQVTSANTWFKKRAGHVTDFWVLDNGVIVRVLRHREPYEIQLLGYTVPDKLPGHLSAATTPALKQRSESTDGQAKAETTETVPLPGEGGKVLAFDDFNDSLNLDWKILHADPTHYSLTKKSGALTITTQKGGFAWSGIDYNNLFLIDCPALPSKCVQITTCISGFNPDAPWQQAGLIFWNDDNNYLKWVCQFGTQRTFSYLGETNAIRKSHRGFAVPHGVNRYWLRMTKQGERYKFLTSMDGKSFVPFNASIDPHGTPMSGGALTWGNSSVNKIGLFVANGLDSQAPEIDASFEFFEVRIYQLEAEPQSESVTNEELGDSQASTLRSGSQEEAGKRYQNDLNAFFSEIDKTYPFFDLKNIRGDWARTKERLTIQVRKCESNSEFMRIILEATKCLRDSHVRIFNNSVDIPWPAPEHYPLIGFMPAEGNTVVIMMSPPGQEGSLPVGTVVKTIDGVDAREYLDARAKETWEAGGHPSPQRARLFAYRIPLKGAKGTKHKIVVQRQDGEEEIVLECTKEARGWPHTYNMPAEMVRVGRSFSYTKLPSGVGYMYLRRVDSSVTQGISEAVKTHPDVRGWIVDLRGNGGGGYSSELIQMIKFLPRPVAVLIDAGCMSAGETLARDIRRNADARLFGSKTAGSSSSKRNWQFPSGIASVIIPTRSRWRADRKPIEYNGIEPDEKIEAVSGDLLKGFNTGIVRAEEYILSQSSKTLETILSGKDVAASHGNAITKGDSSGAVISGRVLDTRGNAVPGVYRQEEGEDYRDKIENRHPGRGEDRRC
jgi:beta-lactamase regulating signal transducer with metallopeptidase domain